MINLKDISSVYFLGIGGIGMSALARYFNATGVTVGGYDRAETPLTSALASEGIRVHYVDDVTQVDKNASLVVYTPAIPAGHAEAKFYRDGKYAMLKRSEVLGLVTQDTFNICVAGTHGKTTTSAMIAHILRDSGYGCNAFLGGISTNYNSNFWSNEHAVSVAEADEYDRSFLQLSPDIAVITAMDADHLDIYGSEKNMQDAFVDFGARLRADGALFLRFGLPRTNEFFSDHLFTYDASNPNADIHATNIHVKNGAYQFEVVLKEKSIPGFTLNMGGLHNLENAMAAIGVADRLGIAEEKIIAAVASFSGVKRRFEYVVKSDDFVMIDDYAHHPEELRALLAGARQLFPQRKLTVVFQPHLFTRTRDFAAEFGAVLGTADELILLPIYPAREERIAGVTSELILEAAGKTIKSIVEKSALATHLQAERPEVLIMAGAGDIDNLIEPIKKLLAERAGQ